MRWRRHHGLAAQALRQGFVFDSAIEDGDIAIAGMDQRACQIAETVVDMGARVPDGRVGGNEQYFHSLHYAPWLVAGKWHWSGGTGTNDP